MYINQLQRDYGSVMKFILNHRLKWQNLLPQGLPFSCQDDVKILYNDWPYGIDNRIVHLVVWVKFELEDDPVTGFLTEGATRQIQEFVNTTFCPWVDPNHVRCLRQIFGLLLLIWVPDGLVQELANSEEHPGS